MTNFRPISAKIYYDYFPGIEHRCGDVWRGLPSMGLLGGHKTTNGIMITPACDVSNFKTETLTYLPILPIESYLAMVGMLPALRKEIFERMSNANFKPEILWSEPGYEPPTVSGFTHEIQRIEQRLATPNLKQTESDHLMRALSGLRVAKTCSTANALSVDLGEMAKLHGKHWLNVKKQIIGNSFRNDIHFLPSDLQPDHAPGIKRHSLIMFRYPITVQSEILLKAQTVPASSWQASMRAYQEVSYSATHFLEIEQPLKVLSLKQEFLSDVLSRFSALYSRIGSPDFSPTSVDKISGEIG